MITLLVGVVITAILSRILGVEQYGSYALLLSYGAILQIIADFGLYLTLTREVAQEPHLEQERVSTITSLRLALFILVFLVGLIGVLIIPLYRPLLIPFIVVQVGLMFQSISQLFMGIYQKYGTVWRATIGDVVGRMIQLAGVLGFSVFFAHSSDATPMNALLYMAAMFTISTAVTHAIHARYVPSITPWRLSFSREEWKRLIRVSWPIAALLILNAIYFRIDIVMISLLRNQYEVGLYGLAYGVIERALFFPAMFGGLLLPQISTLVTKKSSEARKLLEQGVYAMTLVGVIVFIVCAVYAEDIIIFLSGVEFAAAAPLLRALSIALFVMFLGNIFGFTLIALQKQKQLLYLYAVLAFGNVVLNALLIPRFGALAAAYTTVATEATAAIVAGILVYRVLPYSFSKRDGGMALLVAGIAVVVALVLPLTWHVLLRSLIVVLSFGYAAWFFGLFANSRISLLITKYRHENV